MGNPYSNSGVFICGIKNGKIQSFREYLDLAPTLRVNRELEAMKAKR
jgi:ketosteroid isomerase-like protein